MNKQNFYRVVTILLIIVISYAQGILLEMVILNIALLMIVFTITKIKKIIELRNHVKKDDLENKENSEDIT